MIGSNKLELCPAEMMRAVQHYLNTVVVREDHKVAVTAIRQRSQGGYTEVFEVELRAEKEEQ